MEKFKGKTVLITGGASGIGKIMARIALEKGAKVVVWDIDGPGIEQTLREFSPAGDIAGYRVDVSDRAEISGAAGLVNERYGGVDILVSNAGIVVGKNFADHTASDIARTMEVNALAPMYVTQEFLPGMLARGSGHICNVASSAGLISNPRMSVYAASKWSVYGWSDSLRLEMKQAAAGVGVTTVTPYYIDTGMFAGVRSVIPLLKPEKVARHIIRGIERGRAIVSLPWSMRFVRFAQGVLPIPVFDWFVGKVLGIYSTMAYFTGRKN